MSNYNRIRLYYERGWASETQMRAYVQYGIITPTEYEEIIGIAYTTPVE